MPTLTLPPLLLAIDAMRLGGVSQQNQRGRGLREGSEVFTSVPTATVRFYAAHPSSVMESCQQTVPK